ncbi:MAG: imidazole glycerol phosphate synthase subunit HisF [Alphaproteobacteria bacterium]|nr:imidazole glycerol phosphate synthase subunit HisF [Alphaproteobacteria bacterium]
MYQRLIPSILIQNGRLVKGTRYAGYKDAGAPATTARAHNAQGADELVVCDIEASKQGAEPDFETLKKIADECYMPLTFFGAINSEERGLHAMATGADKIGLTSVAYDQPDLIGVLAHRYGVQAVVVGLDILKDAQGEYHLFDHRSGQTLNTHDPFDWAREVVDRGAGELRIMSVDREGTLSGFDLDLYERMRILVDVPLLIEGGAGSLTDIEKAYKAGVNGVCLGAMLVFSDANLVKIKQHMRSQNLNIRP